MTETLLLLMDENQIVFQLPLLMFEMEEVQQAQTHEHFVLLDIIKIILPTHLFE